MAACKRQKLAMLAPAGVAVVAIVLGLLSIFSTQWTTGHFTYHLRGNETIANHTISELKLSADVGVSKFCYTLEVDDGAFLGLAISLPFALVAVFVTIVRRFVPNSDTIYGLSCFFYFTAAIFSGMSAALWGTAYNNTTASLFRTYLPPYAKEHTSRSTGVSLGHPFALTIVSCALYLLGMYLSAYHHTPSDNPLPQLLPDPLPQDKERNIELCPTAAGLMRRAIHHQHGGDM